MRDYTYIGGARFSINNLYRSLRYDIDRLDLSWVDGDKPEFTRGLRIVDNQDSETLRVDGEDADNLIYSLTYLYGKNDDFDSFRVATDEYLKVVFETKEYLLTNHKKNKELNKEVQEAVLH